MAKQVASIRRLFLSRLAILSFTMGMQNATVAVSTGMAVRTTHMTGPATDLGIALAVLVSGSPEERQGARRSLLLRGTKLTSFIVGAACMAALCPRLTWFAFLVPAAAGLAATLCSFVQVATNGDSNVEVRPSA